MNQEDPVGHRIRLFREWRRTSYTIVGARLDPRAASKPSRNSIVFCSSSSSSSRLARNSRSQGDITASRSNSRSFASQRTSKLWWSADLQATRRLRLCAEPFPAVAGTSDRPPSLSMLAGITICGNELARPFTFNEWIAIAAAPYPTARDDNHKQAAAIKHGGSLPTGEAVITVMSKIATATETTQETINNCSLSLSRVGLTASALVAHGKRPIGRTQNVLKE